MPCLKKGNKSSAIERSYKIDTSSHNRLKQPQTIIAKRGLFSPMQTSMQIKWGKKIEIYFYESV